MNSSSLPYSPLYPNTNPPKCSHHCFPSLPSILPLYFPYPIAYPYPSMSIHSHPSTSNVLHTTSLLYQHLTTSPYSPSSTPTTLPTPNLPIPTPYFYLLCTPIPPTPQPLTLSTSHPQLQPTFYSTLNPHLLILLNLHTPPYHCIAIPHTAMQLFSTSSSYPKHSNLSLSNPDTPI